MDKDRKASGDNASTTMRTKMNPSGEAISVEVCFYSVFLCVSGASIDINCETNGDIDAMDCTWKNTQWTKPIFRYR